MRVGRNEPCPCGSGAKFKNCCAGKQKLPRGLVLLIAAIAAIAAIGLIPFLLADKEETSDISSAAAAPLRRPMPQPGPAPAGKVWSAEHNHWHDAPTRSSSPIQVMPSAAPAGAPATPQPQPPGPAPAGKVWSPEHGHWHDAPAQ
ncbi:MAG TPA: SEC-C metal-binding domain-containing protein [Thermoanaerobaculia bacterium]|nr:SEC-C metal-binding domain-containing protein [Thermoanaerobaculia bacterium]